MEITPIGWLLIPLGLMLFIVRSEWLYVLTIFFVPFSATSLLNYGTSGFAPCVFFGSLLLLHQGLKIVLRMKIGILQSMRTPIFLLFIFVGVCAVSLIMPFIIDGRMQVISNGNSSAVLEPLTFKPANIAAILELIYGFFFTALIAHKNVNKKDFLRTIRIYLASGIFICLWGIMQFALYLIHVPYPASVFNNSASPYALGYSATLDSLEAVRVSSVALEPSILAIVLVGMLPIYAMTILNNSHIFGKITDRFALLILCLTLFLTASSTGYIGIAMASILMSYSLFRHGKLRAKFVIVIMAAITISFVAYASIPQLQALVQETLLNKGTSASALERGIVVLFDFKYFLDSPILGLGWGSAPAHDLIMGILANCGILGLTAFFLLIGHILNKLRKHLNESMSTTSLGSPSNIMLISLFATFGSYAISGLPTVETFWVILGLAISAVGMSKNNKLIYNVAAAA